MFSIMLNDINCVRDIFSLLAATLRSSDSVQVI